LNGAQGHRCNRRPQRRKRRGQHRQPQRRQLDDGGLQRELQVRWQQILPPRVGPHAFGEGCVVVAGDHHPGPREGCERVEEAAQRARRDRLRVEDVAGHQHGVGAALGGALRQSLDGGDARLGKRRRVFGRKARVGAADLPVGGVQQQGHRVPSWVSGASGTAARDALASRRRVSRPECRRVGVAIAALSSSALPAIVTCRRARVTAV